MDPRFLRAVEMSVRDGSQYWNVIVRDSTGRSVASAFLSLFHVDPTLFAEPPWKRRLQQILRLVPSIQRLPIVLCGTPVSTGASHLLCTPEADRGLVIQMIEEAMLQIARRHGSFVLVFKEFDDSDPVLLTALEEQGYLRVASLPMNQLPTQFQSFEDLCATRARITAGRSSTRS